MNKLFLSVLMMFCVAVSMTGCGQKQEAPKKMAAVKPIEAVEEEMDLEEEVVTTEAPVVAAPSPAVAAAVSVPTPAPTAAVTATTEVPKPSELLVLADFDTGEKPNNVGGNFGAWNKDPSDPTQWCKESFDNVTRHGDKGFAMKLDYCVDSPNPAYNGFWMMLPNLDATKYDTLNLWVKGDAQAGYTTVFKVEVKNASNQIGRYYVSNVSNEWKQISIPLSDLKGLIDRANLTELVIVFEDRMATNKKGVIHLDDISFSKK